MARTRSPSVPEGKILLTDEDYRALPNDGKRYEVLEGELSVAPAPFSLHQQILRNLFRCLDRYLQVYPLGQLLFAPIDLVLSPSTVLQPDLVFVSRGRDHLITSRAIEGPPDFVVEVLSPSTADLDRLTKAQLYARHSIPHYWLVDPEGETVDAYALAGEGYRLESQTKRGEAFQSPLFPGFQLAAADIFAP